MRLVQIAVPVPQLDALTYSVPDEFADPALGARVLVPLGKRVLTGIVVSTPSSLLAPRSSLLGSRNQQTIQNASSEQRVASNESIKPIIDILDPTPFLPEDVLALARWVAEYYACGIGEAIATAMPPRSAAHRTVRVASLTVQGHESEPLAVKLGARQQEAVSILRGAPDGIDTSELADRGITSATINRLTTLGTARISSDVG